MSYEYSAQIHDWDLTLHSACELLKLGQILDLQPTTGNLPKGFACYSGSMLLSFCAIESFSASVAFSMPNEARFSGFDFEKYKKSKRFWDKIEMLCSALNLQTDKSQGLFQRIAHMQHWRNLVTHASPMK